MKRLADFIGEDEGLFGPGTDLAISLAAILLIMVAIKSSVAEREDLARKQLEAQIQELTSTVEREKKNRLESQAELRTYREIVEQERQGQLEIQEVLDNQARFVEELATQHGTWYREISPNTYVIDLNPGIEGTPPDILIENDATLQRISFGSHALFDPDEIKLLAKGHAILRSLSNVLLTGGRLARIQEIQIQGHADPTQTRKYESNLDLAARRAITVFNTLKHFGIDPRRSMMSATTFGEYVPVQRRLSGGDYSPEQLAQDNDSPAEMKLNRRIEILLIYRRSR